MKWIWEVSPSLNLLVHMRLLHNISQQDLSQASQPICFLEDFASSLPFSRVGPENAQQSFPHQLIESSSLNCNEKHSQEIRRLKELAGGKSFEGSFLMILK